MYKLLLEWETKDELGKSAEIPWARDVGHNIELSGGGNVEKGLRWYIGGT